MAAKHFNIKVTGKVQGVYFRASTKEVADSLGLHGFCKNELDGTVYIEAEGDEHALQQLVKWCHKGPRAAKVTNVAVNEGEWIGFSNFSINNTLGDNPYGSVGE